eukprot:scaffold3444_cov50-Attheya_sp.AAC.2
MAMDGMMVNSLKFLATISKNLFYRTAHYVEGKKPEFYMAAIDSLVIVYTQGGFQIKKILCDNKFRVLMDPLAFKHHITMNYANPQEHVPEAERNIRVIKERVRVTISSYVQGHDEQNPTKTNASRTLDCIYLRYHSTTQGGHELLHLATNKVVIRRNVTPVPITPGVIKRVHYLAEQDGMPKGLKVHNRYGTLIYDSTWIEGVDYTADEFDDENYESENDSDQDEEELDDEYDEIDPDELEDLQQEPPNLDAISQDDEENENTDINEDGEEENADINEDGEEEEEEASSDDEEEEASSDEEEEADESVNPNTVTRSGRISKAADKLNLFHSVESFYQDASNCDIQDLEGVQIEEYTSQNAQVIANVMCHITNKVEVDE